MREKKIIIMFKVLVFLLAILAGQISCTYQTIEEQIELDLFDSTRLDLGKGEFLEINKTSEGEFIAGGVFSSKELMAKILSIPANVLYEKCVVQKLPVKSLINNVNKKISSDSIFQIFLIEAGNDNTYTMLHFDTGIRSSENAHTEKVKSTVYLALSGSEDNSGGSYKHVIRRRHKTLNPHWDNLYGPNLVPQGMFSGAACTIYSKKDVQSKCYSNTSVIHHLVGLWQ